MSEIKPIETVYNGYRFRSRLEARWAVFFDAVGIRYEYEPDGFEVDGEKYLPDFYLPELDVYAEVKPEDLSRIDEICKASRVCCYATNKILILLGEIPNIKECGLWVYNAFYWNVAESAIVRRPAVLCLDEYGSFFMTNLAYLRPQEELLVKWSSSFGLGKSDMPLSGKCLADYENDLPYLPESLFSELESADSRDFRRKAYCQARQARFEHGECGAPK